MPEHISTSSVAVASLDPQGPAADDIAELWWLMLAAGGAVFVAVAVLVLIPALRRRDHDESGNDRTEVEPAAATRWIAGGGVALPSVLLVATLAVSVATMRTLPEADDDPLVIEVVGYQWWWSARYPDVGVTVANELHVPVGRDVELRLRAADVIHSFWAPELHGKLDLLPERTNTLVLVADEAGTYNGSCAEFCGVQHANMNFLVVAEEPAQFDAWLAAQRRPADEPAGDTAQRGEQVFFDAGCAQCHTIRGTEAEATTGPDLTHVATRQTLAADTLANTAENLGEWLRDPEGVKPGTQMPAAELSDADLDALVAYLMGLA